MIHARAETLLLLEPLLQEIRQCPKVKEKSCGVFYYQSKAFVHFHEDESGIFADVKQDDSWERYPVNTTKEQKHFLAIVSRTFI